MNSFEASNEIAEKVRKYRFKNPHTNYEDATEIVCEQNPELEAAFAGTESPRASNIKRQFALDRKLKEDPDNDIIKYQYKVTMAEAMGWREASRIYGIDITKEIIDALLRKILDLETQQALHQKAISNFPDESKRQEQKIEELQNRLGLDIGYTPSPEEIKAEQEKLLELHRNLDIAEEELPGIEAELKELRAKLEKIEAGKKFSIQNRYATPSDELADRSKTYAREHEIDYGIAADEILKEDQVLSTAYEFYDVDTLLGLNG
jgi:phage shock protein A